MNNEIMTNEKGLTYPLSCTCSKENGSLEFLQRLEKSILFC